MWKVLVALAVVVFVAAMMFAVSPWLRGRLSAATWDGVSPLSCYPGQQIVLSGKKVKLAEGAALSAAGDCVLELDQCEISAPMALSAGGNAKVTVRGGRIDGAVDVAGNATLEMTEVALAAKPVALAVAGNAHATVRGGTIAGEVALEVDGDAKAEVSAELTGAVRVGGNGRLTGTPALDRAQAARDLSARWAPHACDPIVPCYSRAGAFGNVAGRLTAMIAPGGAASDATLENREAPATVRECLLASARHARLDGYDGPAGKLRCDFAGTLLPGGTRRMSYEPSFTIGD